MEAKTEKTIKESLKTSSNGSEKSLADNEAKGRGFERWEGRVARGRLRGEPGPMKGLAPPGFERGPMCDGPMTGIAPIRAMRRMRLYPDLRGHRRRDRRMRMAPPPHPLPAPPSAPTPATPQAPPMHHRVPFPPRHGPPPPPLPNHPFFRGHVPHPQGPGMPPPGPPCHFDPRAPRGYYNGPVFPPPHCPPGRGQRWPGPHDMGQRWPGWSGRDQRWPGPPGGRRF